MQKDLGLNSIEDIIDLYKKYGDNDYIGEKINQTEHGIQAALLAKEEGSDDESIVAALLHDIGHLIGIKCCLEQMENVGCMRHEHIGADALRNLGMNQKTCELIRNHVNTKRYLVTKDNSYYDQLSIASKTTLKFQGGKMDELEMKQFESSPFFDLFIKMRIWDDKAKIKDMKLPGIEDFKVEMKKCIY